MATATLETIRDRIIVLIQALTPTSLSADKFRVTRDEGAADFRAQCEAAPAACFRRFQVQSIGGRGRPEVSDTATARHTQSFAITVAYPNTSRYGGAAGRDRNDVIDEDLRQLESSVGVYGRANFSGTNDCTPLGFDEDPQFERGSAVTYLTITARFIYTLIIAACTVAAPADPPAGANRMVVLMGQSNAMGKGTGAGMGLSSTYPAVQFFERSAASLGEPVTFVADDATRDLGPRVKNFGGSYTIGSAGVELQLGRDLVAGSPGDTWYIAKAAVDGSSIVLNWTNAAFPAAGPSLAEQTKTFINDRIAEYGITDVANNVILVWIQGTADTGQAYATEVAAYESLFADFRSQFGNVRIVVNRTIDSVDSGTVVRASQEAFVAETSGTAIIRADDLTLQDAAHYDNASYVTLGSRIATAILNLINGTAQTSPYLVAVGLVTQVNSTGSITPTMPPHQTNDLLVMILGGIGNNAYTLSNNPSSAWAATPSSPQHDGGAGGNARVQAWYAIATSGSMAAPTIGDAASDDVKRAFVMVIRGANASPFDVTAGSTAATSTSVSIDGVTTTAANDLVIAACAAQIDNATIEFSDPTNASLTELMTQMNWSTASGGGGALGVFTGRKAAPGAVSATTATLANTGTQANLTLAVKP